jgi:predicted amidohydrolase YtcJ
MRTLRRTVVALTLTLVGCTQDGVDYADVVFRGGTVYTVDAHVPTAEAVAVRGARIVYVGDELGVEALIGPSTEVVDLTGRMLLPGFHDTHVHPTSGGIELGECDLNGALTRAEVVRIVRGCGEEGDPDGWVRGGGFELPLFPDGAPSRELLDSLVPDRPAFLTSADAHTGWANSRALEIAGITEATPDPPPDGIIVRAADGQAQGTLRESAMGLVARHLPDYSDVEIRQGLERGIAMATSFGITTVHEANATEPFVRAYAALAREGRLDARAIIGQALDLSRGPAQVADLIRIREENASSLVHPTAAKIFLDGVIEGQTAALLEEYEDRPGWRGELTLPPEELDALIEALDAGGFKVHVHAIGDRAIRVALDAFAAQAERDGGMGPRHVMAHIQLIDPADIPRFAALGVVASFQPLWFFADSYITDLTEPRLGPARSRWLYPARSLLETGAITAAGSDWSVSSMDPLRAIEVAVTRRDPTLDTGAPWIPDEVLSLETMLSAYTLQGAIAGDMDAVTGTITVGKLADMVVLDADLFSLPPERISDAKVVMTLLEGRVVYRR